LRNVATHTTERMLDECELLYSKVIQAADFAR
jgi:hypothetical protein